MGWLKYFRLLYKSIINPLLLEKLAIACLISSACWSKPINFTGFLDTKMGISFDCSIRVFKVAMPQ